MIKKIFAALLFAVFSTVALGQGVIIRGESSAGVYENVKTDGSQHLQVQVPGTVTVAVATTDPCLSSAIAKSSVIISITTATTTQLVALSGTTKIYVCGFTLTISQVATTANTLKFVQGTGAACGTGTSDLTGTFGAGGVTATAPIVIAPSVDGTEFSTNAGSALCATTTIGATASFQGVLTYIQQ